MWHSRQHVADESSENLEWCAELEAGLIEGHEVADQEVVRVLPLSETQR